MNELEKELKYQLELREMVECSEEMVRLLRIHLDDSYYTEEEVKKAAQKIQVEQKEITEMKSELEASVKKYGEL